MQRQEKPELPPSKRPEYRRQYDRNRRLDPVVRDMEERYKREWERGRSPAARSLQHLRKTYGLSPEQYAAMLDNCDYKCQICQQPVRHITDTCGRADKACVDHDHATGYVRGILCHSCNRQLTFVELHRNPILDYLDGKRPAVPAESAV